MKKTLLLSALFLVALLFALISCSHSTENNTDAEEKIVPVESVRLNKSSISLKQKEKAALSATVSPYNATNKKVFWSCSGSNISIKDNGDGTVDILAENRGSATVTVKTEDGEFTEMCSVEVKDSDISVTGLRIENAYLSLSPGAHITMNATVYPANATNKNILWTSDSDWISVSYYGGYGDYVDISVSEYAWNGLSATITARTEDGGYSQSCSVSVVEDIPVEGLWIENANEYISLIPGAHITMEVIVYPENATNKNVLWTANSDWITISGFGEYVDVLVAEDAEIGSKATITATTEDSGYSQSCYVNVIENIPVENIWMDYPSRCLLPGDYVEIKASVYPDNATAQDILWTATDGEYITIENHGYIASYGYVAWIRISEDAPDGLTACITATSMSNGCAATCDIEISTPKKVIEVTLPNDNIHINPHYYQYNGALHFSVWLNDSSSYVWRVNDEIQGDAKTSRDIDIEKLPIGIHSISVVVTNDNDTYFAEWIVKVTSNDVSVFP